MKTVFIPVHHAKEIIIPQKEIKKLPLKIIIATTAQYLNKISSVEKQLVKEK